MVMDTIQVRLSHGLVQNVDGLVKTGLYSSRSDVLRDAVRKLLLESVIGIIPDTGDSVKEIRKIRKKLSKAKFDLNEINKMAD
ncbi:ribbon-helix-helix domain-containing protein [Candidatus Woesearchaeota archaeon]|nr:ribbon-helix-helix domain-containing protein [Candidatus Woesearchaeota archaeon]